MANAADWRGELGADWARNEEAMSRMLAPFGQAARAPLGDLAGRTVLDLGCGGGETTFDLAAAAKVAIGLDVSPDLIALAARRRHAAGIANAALICGDAAELSLGQPADALYSRFGAMFFDRPVEAYARIRGQMRRGAKLSVVCWRGLKENGWAFLPLVASNGILPAAPTPPPGAPGPFAWGKPETSFVPVLKTAGWRKIRWEPVDQPITMGAGLPGSPEEAAADNAMQIGPVARRAADAPAAMRRRLRAALAEAFAPHVKTGAVTLNGACWVVTAKA